MFQADDLLNALFGGSGPSMMHSRGFGGAGSYAAKAVVVPVGVTLEELYCGATKEVARTRDVVCGTCKGRGTKANASKTQPRCPLCRGAGARTVVQQMGMMVQSTQVVCNGCNGSGERVDPRDVCTACAGNKIVTEESCLAVSIARGMSHGEKIVFPKAGDAHPRTLTPADVAVVLQMEKHATFVRNGDDLHVKHNITLAEALCGFQFKLTHLDGRELTVRRDRGEITRPGEMNMIQGEGMPIKGKPDKNGDLFVHLEIVYPDALSPEQLRVLREALPQSAKQPAVNEEEDDYHICYALRTSVAEFRAEMEQEEIDEDNDDEGVHVSGCPMQ